MFQASAPPTSRRLALLSGSGEAEASALVRWAVPRSDFRFARIRSRIFHSFLSIHLVRVAHHICTVFIGDLWHVAVNDLHQSICLFPHSVPVTQSLLV